MAVFNASDPLLATGDRGLHGLQNEQIAGDARVTHLIIPRSGAISQRHQVKERPRPWRRAYRWRAAIDGRLSSLRRDHGLGCCPDHREDGFIRYIGSGISASNLHHVGHHLAAKAGREDLITTPRRQAPGLYSG
jgi:IS5 family transposase